MTEQILACAFEVHRELGPGLLETAYRTCLAHQLEIERLAFVQETPIPITYKGLTVESAYRADLIVEKRVLLELKAVEKLLPVHEAQLLTYLKLSDLRVGFLMNFNVTSLRHGLRRFVR